METSYTLVGWRKNDFDLNGQHFTGYRLYFTSPLSGPGTSGLMTSSTWISDQKFADLHAVLNMKCELRYNRWGKIDHIVKL